MPEPTPREPSIHLRLDLTAADDPLAAVEVLADRNLDDHARLLELVRQLCDRHSFEMASADTAAAKELTVPVICPEWDPDCNDVALLSSVGKPPPPPPPLLCDCRIRFVVQPRQPMPVNKPGPVR